MKAPSLVAPVGGRNACVLDTEEWVGPRTEVSEQARAPSVS